MALTLYGISNCDTVRKARHWLDTAEVEYRFHDFRQDGLDSATVERWLSSREWDGVINRRSTSWKALSAHDRASMNAGHAVAAAVAAPTLIKRPVLEDDGLLEFGFSESRYATLLS
ncbi:MAG: arsenate reductase [Glaciecola sp.]|jgi:arsenate reductase|uniref:Spx/MgsR family RNA polymerase-binding regulatory protein n=1 Tax=Congregibacter sp. TaxID=2744308 RepID=UPI0039E6FC42